MREYELVIDEALKNGLSPELYTPFNLQVLYKALGVRCGKLGLEAYVELDNPLPGTVDLYYSWPFPQMLVGEKYNILVVRDDFSEEDIVYEVLDDNSVATQIAVVDKLTFGQGELMEMADFGKYAIMMNGVIIIYWDISLTAWKIVTTLTNVPMMKTICNLKGQLIGGNVVSSWPIAESQCDETYYVWSKIGDIDCTPDRYNTSGYRRCPYGGEIMHVRRLEDKVIGYSDKGITLISPVSSPISTLGFKEIYDNGVINKGAVSGNLKNHIFVDEDYNIVKIIEDYSYKVLGYQKYMKELVGEDIIVNFDRKKGDYFIGNSIKTFLLSSNGLTEIQQHPSTIWRRNKKSYMLPDIVNDFEPEIISNAFDMGYKGQKTNQTIESDAINHNSPEAGVDYSYDLNNWKIGEFKPINKQGISTIIKSGNYFRFKLKFDYIKEDFRISYIKSRYKMTDLRGIRGVYAPPPRGQI